MSIADAAIEDSSIGSAGSLAVRQRHFVMQPFTDDLSGNLIKILRTATTINTDNLIWVSSHFYFFSNAPI